MDNDPRNRLYELYFQVLQKYEPKVFVFENVPGLFTAGKGTYLKAILKGFDELGYDLECKMHQVKDIAMIRDADYGFMIWDGESRGTRYNIDRMMQQQKRTLVHIPHKQLTYLVLEEGQQAVVRPKGVPQAE